MEKTNEKVCKNADSINKINKNLKGVDETQIDRLIQEIRKCRRVIIVAEGRSDSAITIATKKVKKRLFKQTESNWPWRDITEAAMALEKKQGTTVLLINSGSGETTTPKEMAKDLRSYIRKTGSHKFVICAVTSNLNSTIAEQADLVVELKGSKKKLKKKGGPLDLGTLGDLFELGSMMLLWMIMKAVNNNFDAKKIKAMMAEEMKMIGRIIDEYTNSRHYRKLVKEIAARTKTIFGGVGPDREIANMVVIRMLHIKRVVGDEVYLAGSKAHPPRPGILLILISFSGKTKSTLQWLRDYKKGGGIIFSITGKEKSSLARRSKSYILKVPVSKFYLATAFLLSPLPGGVLEEFRRCGISIPEEMLRVLGHTKTE